MQRSGGGRPAYWIREPPASRAAECTPSASLCETSDIWRVRWRVARRIRHSVKTPAQPLRRSDAYGQPDLPFGNYFTYAYFTTLPTARVLSAHGFLGAFFLARYTPTAPPQRRSRESTTTARGLSSFANRGNFTRGNVLIFDEKPDENSELARQTPAASTNGRPKCHYDSPPRHHQAAPHGSHPMCRAAAFAIVAGPCAPPIK